MNLELLFEDNCKDEFSVYIFVEVFGFESMLSEFYTICKYILEFGDIQTIFIIFY